LPSIQSWNFCVIRNRAYNPNMPGINDTLNNRYKLVEEAGAGGMATVLKAQDQVLGRMVAIKLLHPAFTRDPDFVRRFRHEAHAAANLTHPNIITVHDVGQAGDSHYIVMEYVEGRTVKQIIRYYRKQGRPMSINRAVDLTIQICQGVGYAHRVGFVHCDIKPQNVIVTRDLRVKVADFGIARAVSQAPEELRSEVWGTPQYFSPEQASGKSPSPATDVYSIGVILFEMLTGELPFIADTPAELAKKHLYEPPRLVREVNPSVPPALAQIVHKVLSKEPAGRYRTAGQLGRILQSYRFPLRQAGETDSTSPEIVPDTGATPSQIARSESITVATQPFVTRRASETTPPPITADSTNAMYVSLEDEGSENIPILLALLTIVALLGLIPLWYLVYQQWASILQ
jgi:serine/threonine-protein kinase